MDGGLNLSKKVHGFELERFLYGYCDKNAIRTFCLQGGEVNPPSPAIIGHPYCRYSMYLGTYTT